MVTGVATLRDPALQGLGLRGESTVWELGRGHVIIGVLGQHPGNGSLASRFSGHEGGLARFSAITGHFP